MIWSFFEFVIKTKFLKLWNCIFLHVQHCREKGKNVVRKTAVLCNALKCQKGQHMCIYLQNIWFLRATETHALAAANQQKNDRLRAAFGISSDYVDGSSFHADRKEKEKERREQERLEREKLQQQKYTWGKTFQNIKWFLLFQVHMRYLDLSSASRSCPPLRTEIFSPLTGSFLWKKIKFHLCAFFNFR